MAKLRIYGLKCFVSVHFCLHGEHLFTFVKISLLNSVIPKLCEVEKIYLHIKLKKERISQKPNAKMCTINGNFFTKVKYLTYFTNTLKIEKTQFNKFSFLEVAHKFNGCSVSS